MAADLIVLHPNIVRARSRLICRFPFYGPAKELSAGARKLARKRARNIMADMPPALKTESMAAESSPRIKYFREQSERFLSGEWEKSLRHSIDSSDFMDAWPRIIVGHLSAVIENLTKGNNNARVLQVGCSWGPMLEFFRTNLGIEAYGLEPDEEAIDLAGRLGRKYIRKGIVQNIPFKEGSFDIVLTRNLLASEYFLPYWPAVNSFEEREAFRREFRENAGINCNFNAPHLIRIFSEISRVLKNGGYFVSYLEDFVQPRYLSRDFSRFFFVENWREDLKVVQK